jgi:type I restriction enzyme S subunit
MSNEWKLEKLGDLCQFVRGPFGGSLKKGIFKKDGYAVYEQQHAIYNQFSEIRYFVDEKKFNEMKRFELNSGDLIMSCSGTMGKIAIVPENIKKGIINQALLKLTPSKKVAIHFLKLWMESQSFQDSLKKYSGGAAIQNVASVAILKEIEIPLPPLSEQKHIVEILDETFAAIDKAKANVERNLQNAKELFESYLQNAFANKGEDWEEKRLGEVLQKTETIDPTKKPNQEFTYIDVSSVNKENFQIENTALLKGKDAPSRARKLIKTNDIIFATVRPTLKRIAIISANYNEQVCSTGYFVLRASARLDYRIIFYYLQTKTFLENMEKLQRGASYPAVTDGDVKDQIINFPKSLQEQNLVADRLDNISIELKNLETIYRQKLNDLEELKKSILQKAFNGELTEKELVRV